MATTLVRRRIVEDFTQDKGLKLELVSAQIGFVLASVIAKLQTAFAGAARVTAGLTKLHEWRSHSLRA